MNLFNKESKELKAPELSKLSFHEITKEIDNTYKIWDETNDKDIIDSCIFKISHLERLRESTRKNIV